MIGWINLSVEAYILETYGESTWNEVIAASGVQYPWVSSCPYSDSITYKLFQTAAKVLDIPVNQALEAYGLYFIHYADSQGYMKLLRVLGSDILEFLENLNNLHLHLTMCWPMVHAPAFRCDKVTPESLHLHYYSSRPGLHPIVVGVLKGLAREYFKFTLDVQLLQSRDQGHDHEVFLITFERQAMNPDLSPRMMHAQVFLVSFPYQPSISRSLQLASAVASGTHSNSFSMPANIFHQLHPFHLVLDRQCRLIQWGHVLGRLYPTITAGAHVLEYFYLHHPYVDFVWADIVASFNTAFVLRSKISELELRGSMLPTTMPQAPGSPDTRHVLLFVGSPRCSNLNELQSLSLFLSDLPVCDMTRDYILLAEQRQAEAGLKERLERLTHELKEEKARSDALVQRMSGLLASFPFQGAGKEQDGDGSADGADASDTCYDDTLSRIQVIDAVRRAMQPMMTQRGSQDDHIDIVEPIGEGKYGKVYKGLWQGTEVAIKTLILPANMKGSEKREKMAIMEAAISSSLSHPNVVQTYTYTIRPLRDGTADASCSSTRTAPSNNAASTLNVGTLVAPGTLHAADSTRTTKPSPPSAGPALDSSPQSPTKPQSNPNQNLSQSPGRKGSSPEAGPAAGPASPGKTASAAGTIHSYEVHLVLELCDRGSLRDALENGAFMMSDGELNYGAVLHTAMDIAKAMIHLHRQNVLHGDLKARNILLKSSGSVRGRAVVAKVADFGLSIKMKQNATHVPNMFQGTITHMAPELLLDGRISKAADVYAYGVLMWELFTGGHAFRGMPRAMLCHQITVEDQRPVFPPHTPPRYKQLTEWCWNRDASVRPTFEEILQALQIMHADRAATNLPLSLHGCSAGAGSSGSNQGAAACPHAAAAAAGCCGQHGTGAAAHAQACSSPLLCPRHGVQGGCVAEAAGSRTSSSTIMTYATARGTSTSSNHPGGTTSAFNHPGGISTSSNHLRYFHGGSEASMPSHCHEGMAHSMHSSLDQRCGTQG